MLRSTVCLLAALLLPCACRSAALTGDVEATSLTGRELHRPPIPAERRAALEQDLAGALAAWEADPADELAAIWVGRRLAYLGRYREAILWYGARLEDFPESYRLLRHRGHRYISVRRFDDAIEDLARAANLSAGEPDAVEPDGAPNAYDLPRSSTQSNIRYHLALALYLSGQFDLAAAVFSADVEAAWNDDHLVAATNWLHNSLRRAGRWEEARAALEPIGPEMGVIENTGYWKLCLLYKGLLTPSEVLGAGDGVVGATVAYGVANWRHCNGNARGAREDLERIAAESPWNAFGTIAAEADLSRLGSAGD